MHPNAQSGCRGTLQYYSAQNSGEGSGLKSIMKSHKIQITGKDTNNTSLPFERPIVELEKTIFEMKARSESGIDLSGEIKSAEKKLDATMRKIFRHLTPWQRVQV